MRTLKPLFTRADYALLPEGFPAQLVGGLLVKDALPISGHQMAVNAILSELLPLVGRYHAFGCPMEVVVDDWNVFHPDVIVLREPPRDPESCDIGIPILVVEVLSPGTERRDRRFKKDKYLGAGVDEVWIADRKGNAIEVHDRDGVRAVQGSGQIRSRALPGFALVPDEVFAPPPR